MKAVWIKEFGGVENLELREVDYPAPPKDDEVLVRVMAAGLNRADLVQLAGKYPAPPGYPAEIPGLEFAGEVTATGAAVTSFTTGDRVFGITAGGAQAEYLVTKESHLAAIPEGLSFAEAAAIPEAFITAHDAVFTQAGLQDGETLLIHAVGSGVGLAALQLARAAGGAVIGTSRTQDKLDACREFGLDHGILTDGDVELAAAVMEKTNERGADVILDLVGAKYFEANLQSLAKKGRIMLVGLTGGAQANFDLGLALRKRARITGTVLRARSSEEKSEVTRAFAEQVVPLFANGKLRPNVDVVHPLKEVKEAYEYLASNASFGKVILDLQD